MKEKTCERIKTFCEERERERQYVRKENRKIELKRQDLLFTFFLLRRNCGKGKDEVKCEKVAKSRNKHVTFGSMTFRFFE